MGQERTHAPQQISSFNHLVGARRQRLSTERLTRDEAFLLAVNIAKLPSVPRQILKDIPRPPNSTSWED
jgi:hypothetical protein